MNIYCRSESIFPKEYSIYPFHPKIRQLVIYLNRIYSNRFKYKYSNRISNHLTNLRMKRTVVAFKQ